MGNKLNYILPVFAAIICLVIYIITLNPSVGFMDSGELAAAVYTFGVPHPTGYPLYLIMGYLISHLPLGNSIIYRLNFFSAVITAASIPLFFSVVYRVLNIYNDIKKSKKNDDKNRKAVIFDNEALLYISFFSSICFGLFKTIWSNAVTNEVYGLHVFFIMLILLFSVKIYVNLARVPLKLWMYLFLAAGFSFSNHLTTIFTAPALIYLLYLQYKSSAHSIKKILLSTLFIIPGFLLYGVLIIASAPGPYFNWSNPVNLPNLLYHMSGGDFSHLLQAASGVIIKNLKLFGSEFFGELAIASGVISIIGLISLYLKKTELFIFFILLLLSSLAFGINYYVRDVQNYFILLYIVLGSALSVGIYEIIKYFAGSGKKLKVPLAYVIAGGIVLSAVGAAYNYSEINESKSYVIEDFTNNLLSGIEQNSLIVSYDWGYSYPAMLYFQLVEGKRQDLKIVMLRFLAAPWYLNTVKKYYPELYKSISKEAEDYISTYTSDDTRNPQKLINLVKAFFKNNVGKIPVYVTSDLKYSKDMPALFNDYGWKPGSLCYKIIPKSELYDSTAGMNSLDYTFRPYQADTKERRTVKITTAGIYYDFAIYHNNNNDKQKALLFLNKSLTIENLPDAIKLKNAIINETKK